MSMKLKDQILKLKVRGRPRDLAKHVILGQWYKYQGQRSKVIVKVQRWVARACQTCQCTCAMPYKYQG